MTGGNRFEGRLEIGEGLDTVDLRGRGGDQRCDAGPGAAALVMSGEERVLPGQRQFPFILPMSGRSIGFMIDGMPIWART